MTPEDYIQGAEASVKRNPRLADLMYYAKDIESFGTGLRRISQVCDEAGVKVEFRLMKMGFAVVFYRQADHTNIADERLKETMDGSLDGSLGGSLSAVEQVLFELIKDKPGITWNEAAQSLSKSRRTVQRYFNDLKDKKIIRRAGSKRDGYWEIIGSGKEPRS
ncbi:MAG: winged helix-turn-helix transcriptional regulator [Oscillospiraceae bacterium]|jgi:ATP-dependent DNA helicase RecG|nr:winged helix-turn-helix transcriptional regulator [Oscillospiraceae bacterium]